jgi:hypothetical protein
MGKRRSEINQETKEEYEAREHREEMEGGSSNNMGGFARASKEALKTRRIVRVSSRFKNRMKQGQGGALATPGGSMVTPGTGAPIRTPKAATSAMSPSNNPFANTVLSTPGAVANAASNDSKPNPFASIKFASTSQSKPNTTSATTATPNFQFGGATTTTGASTTKPAKPFSFSANTSTTKSSITISSSTSSSVRSPISSSTSGSNLPPLRNGAKQNDTIPFSKGTLLNLEMLRMAQLEHQANPLSDWSCWLEKYSKRVEEVKDSDGVRTGANTGASTISDVVKESKEEESSNSKSASGFGGFSFGGGASTSDIAEAASTSSKKEFSGFSFGPATTTTTAPPKSAAPTTTPILTSPSTTEEANPDQVVKAVNEDEEELFECRAKYRKFIEEEKVWKSYSVGILRVSKSKSNGSSKLVIRDATVGKVQFNVGVAKGMMVKEPQKSKGKGNIFFVAIQDPKVGPEKFLLVVKAEDADGLYASMKSITG